MNKLLFLLLFIGVAVFQACSDDDSTNLRNVNVIENATLPADLPELYQDFYEENGGLNYAIVNGHRMAYIDNKVEDKPLILLLHGLPDHNFLYRDVIRILGDEYRVIALDHIGYGLSDQPLELEYSFTTLSEYVDGFISVLELADINLVITDVGGPAGLGFAANNPSLVKSITLFETIWEAVDDLENSNYAPPFQEFLLNIRTDGIGEDIVINQNQMIAFLDQLTVSTMTPEVQEVYEYPWLERENRKILLENSRSIPVEGTPIESKVLFDNFENYLMASQTPKMIIQITPGAITPPDYIDAAIARFPQSRKTFINDAGHFATEDKPSDFTNLLIDFIDDVN